MALFYLISIGWIPTPFRCTYYSVVLRLVSYERKGHLEMASAKSVPAMAGDKLQNFTNFSNSELQAEVFDWGSAMKVHYENGLSWTTNCKSYCRTHEVEILVLITDRSPQRRSPASIKLNWYWSSEAPKTSRLTHFEFLYLKSETFEKLGIHL